MSDWVLIIAIVEGPTERIFVDKLLAPYLRRRNIYMKATIVGQKGGDVRFPRVKKDIEIHLKQRSDTYVTTLVDYYGTKGWPGLGKVQQRAAPAMIAKTINAATKAEVCQLFSQQRADKRFIPNMSIHEFEAFLFSDSAKLATELNVNKKQVDQILRKYKEPEAINNNVNTAPSKRLVQLSKPFTKTNTGINIATAIGIETIRQKCPVFNAWLEELEALSCIKP